MTSLVRRHPLLTFFFLAYLGSWAWWSPWWLSQDGLGVLAFQPTFAMIAGINQLGLFGGPFAAAVVVTRICDGREAVSALLGSITQWRSRPSVILVVLLAIPAVIVIGYVVAPGSAVAPAGGLAVTGSLIINYFVYVVGGPLQEEPGWRGFALPRLQAKVHPLLAALILGVVHGLWHAPLFLTDAWDTARDDPSQFVAYLVLVVSLSVVLSWVANSTRGGLLLVILAHNGVNWGLLVAATLTGAKEVPHTWPAAIGLSVLALIATIVSRGRLGLPLQGVEAVTEAGTSHQFPAGAG